MPFLNNAEIHFVKCDPNRPERNRASANDANSKPQWSVQLRTTDPVQRDAWKDMGLRVKVEMPDDDPTKVFWKVNLYRKSIKADNTPSEPPEVVDGALDPLDPNKIGNGSRANIRIYQYENRHKPGELVTILMGIQVTVLKPYHGSRESFAPTEMRTEGSSLPPPRATDGFQRTDTVKQPPAPPMPPTPPMPAPPAASGRDPSAYN